MPTEQPDHMPREFSWRLPLFATSAEVVLDQKSKRSFCGMEAEGLGAEGAHNLSRVRNKEKP